MSDCNCPYCDADVEIFNCDGYGYEEDKTFEKECDNCGKTFVFRTYMHYTHEASKADCLNGGEHRYNRWHQCRDCGHKKRVYATINKEASGEHVGL